MTLTGKLHEHTANTIIARWLNSTGRDWLASGERTSVITENNSERPDIVLRQGDRMPVIVESEYGKPAVGDARKRLNKHLQGESRPFTEIIALGIDKSCELDSETQFRDRLDSNQQIFTVQLVSLRDKSEQVWPEKPLRATPADLTAYCEYAQVPQAVIDDQSIRIANSVASVGAQLQASIEGTANLSEDTFKKLRGIVGSDSNDEAAKTACAIWLIAMDLQNDLATHSSKLQEAGLLTTDAALQASGSLLPSNLLPQWRIIETVDYLSVMENAIASLDAGNMGSAIAHVLKGIDDLAKNLNGLHAKHIYNFAGELWQRLVSDREERAAHYTRPAVAELLSVVAAQRFEDRTPEQLTELNLMGAACGTGTLLGAGERALRRMYANAGGKDPSLHKQRMENHIYGLDVNGIAGTLTAKRLTDLAADQDYRGSKIAVVTAPAGSLTLLDPTVTSISKVLGYRSATPVIGLDGEYGAFHVSPRSIQWVLMNPPYSRPRKGRVQATTGLSKPRRRAKSQKFLMSNGQAGLASDFGDLSNIRLAFGGVLAHVLPLTAAKASSWQSWRAELEKDFEKITIVTNSSRAELQSMSADTNMEEMLVVATKRSHRPSVWRPTTVLCVNLNAAPTTIAEGYALAKEITGIPAGEERGRLTNGSWVRLKQAQAGFPWVAAGTLGGDLTEVTSALLVGKAYDPQRLESHPLALDITKLGNMAKGGPTHHVLGHLSDGDPRGAFEWIPIVDDTRVEAHRSMWRADAQTQSTMTLGPTHFGVVKDNDLAKRLLPKQSQWFLSRGLRWTTQAIALAHTNASIHGGRAWNALQEVDGGIAQAIALFYNSIFGSIVRQAYGQTQQAGRATIQVKAVEGLPSPAFHADTSEARRAREIASQRFDELSALKLQPFAYCFKDSNRHRIDDAVAEMLGFDSLDADVQAMLAHYRLIFASEPNVNGRQKSILKALKEFKSA